MLIDEWPIYAAINRREYKQAQERLNRMWRAILDEGVVAGTRITYTPLNHSGGLADTLRRDPHALDRVLDNIFEFAGNGTTRSENMRDVITGTIAAGAVARGQNANAAAQSILPGLLHHINERISMITERQDASGRAIERLINPRPLEVRGEKESPPPREPVSTEDHLNAILIRLEYVCRLAEDQAAQLNSAV